MANELIHASVGTELTQAEWESITAHVLDAQAVGDTIYASTLTQLRRLAIGATNTVLRVSGGIPGWSATLAGLTLTAPAINGIVTTTGLTLPAFDCVPANDNTTVVRFGLNRPVYLKADWPAVAFNARHDGTNWVYGVGSANHSAGVITQNIGDLSLRFQLAAAVGSAGATITMEEVFLIHRATIADETCLQVFRNLAGVRSLQQVTQGAADSGGAGYRVLRIPN